VEHPSHPVPEVLLLEGELSLASGALVADNVLELDGDGVVEPREDHVVHLVPRWRQRGDDVVEDMVGEGEPPECEDHMSAPARVVGAHRVQHYEHKRLNVEGGDGVGFEPRGVRSLRSHRGSLMGYRGSGYDQAGGAAQRPSEWSRWRPWRARAPWRQQWPLGWL
jgi:hypothetical protein